MKSLKQFIAESVTDPFMAGFDFKVSYRSFWDEDGTHYTRLVSIKCSEEQLKELNERIGGNLQFGDNFSKLTVSRAFDELIGMKTSVTPKPRSAGQHNTLFRIKESK